jgi:hypothetical protein
MADDDLYRFVINAYTPDTIPMSRLAEYMADISVLFGEKASVHFVKLEGGSTGLAMRVDHEAQPKVDARVREVTYRQAPVEAIFASERIDRRLRDDNADGYVSKPKGAKIIEFPGVKRMVHAPYAPFWQPGHIVGIVADIGNRMGKSSVVGRATANVHLEGPVPYNCSAKRSVAQDLKKFLLTDIPVRCFGNGRWERGADGRWTLLAFDIERFEPLNKRGLSEVVNDLREIPGRWKDGPNPLDLLRESKTGDEDDGEIQ